MREQRCTFCGAKNHHANGLCQTCYNRARRNHGDPSYKRDRTDPRAPANRVDRRNYYASNLVPRSQREFEILELLSQGQTYKQIAGILGISFQRVGHIVSQMKRREN